MLLRSFLHDALLNRNWLYDVSNCSWLLKACLRSQVTCIDDNLGFSDRPHAVQVEKKKKLFCRLSTVAGADPDANISPPRAPKARNTHESMS